MPAAPFPPDESQRIQTLLRCHVLDTDPEPEFDDLTRIAAAICETPIALVSLLDRDRQWFKSHHGLDATETPRDQAFCGYAILADDPLVVEDASLDPRFVDNPLVTGPPHIRFYAGYPLKLSSGEALGTLCVIDVRPHSLSAQQLDTLRALAIQASSQLELRYTIEKLNHARAEADEANQAKSLFLANMSHELRTPLTAILGFAELLTDDLESKASEATLEAVDTIYKNGRHLLTLLNDLLDLSRIEAGKMSIERIPTNLDQLVGEVVDLLKPRANAKGLTLDCVLDPKLPGAIITDPTRLRQILINLAGNSIKFTERGGVKIEIGYDPHAQDLTIQVEDTGVGMTPEQLERVLQFETFCQGDVATTRRYGGSGLGLRISHLLAQLLGGTIEINSQSGTGTQARVTLEASPAGTATAPDPAADAPAKSSPAKPLKATRILLAEDGPDNQRLFRALLVRAGAEVTTAPNGAVALEELRNQAPFDLVLMDVQMPVLGGLEATRTLRSWINSGEVPKVPIVALTANAMDSDRDRCLAAGCDEYISKPVDKDEFIEICRHVMETETVQ